jgi:hypothetical protein
MPSSIATHKHKFFSWECLFVNQKMSIKLWLIKTTEVFTVEVNGDLQVFSSWYELQIHHSERLVLARAKVTVKKALEICTGKLGSWLSKLISKISSKHVLNHVLPTTISWNWAIHHYWPSYSPANPSSSYGHFPIWLTTLKSSIFPHFHACSTPPTRSVQKTSSLQLPVCKS